MRFFQREAQKASVYLAILPFFLFLVDQQFFLAGGCCITLDPRDRTKQERNWASAWTGNIPCFF